MKSCGRSSPACIPLFFGKKSSLIAHLYEPLCVCSAKCLSLLFTGWKKKGERTSNVTSSYLYTSFIFYLYAKHGFIKSAQPCFDWDLTKMGLLPLNPFINTHIIGKKTGEKQKQSIGMKVYFMLNNYSCYCHHPNLERHHFLMLSVV